MAKYNIDAIDQKILMHLIGNARMPFLEIARECGISGAAIHQRVKKLEDAGIITGSRLEIDPKALGNDVCAYVGIQISQSNFYDQVIESLRCIPEIVECHFITGKYSLFIKLYCRNNEHLMNIMVNIIKEIPGISQTETFLSLDQSFERQVNVPKVEDKK
ncbi:MAG: Lrp/AsnC ligand binding domain-containing protein [Rikenellaceae bacterium]